MGRKREFDPSLYFCPNEARPNYGKFGSDNQIIRAGHSGKCQNQLFKCKVSP